MKLLGRLLLFLLLPAFCFSQETQDDVPAINLNLALAKAGFLLHQPHLVREFYKPGHLYWFSNGADSANRCKLQSLLSAAELYALEQKDYRLPPGTLRKDLDDTIRQDILYSDAALSFMHDLAYGKDTAYVRYNYLKYHPNNLNLPALLMSALSDDHLVAAITGVEPRNERYNCIRDVYLRILLASQRSDFTEIKITSSNVSFNNHSLVAKLTQLGYLNAVDTLPNAFQSALFKFQRLHQLPVQTSLSSACLRTLNEPVHDILQELKWNIHWFRWLNVMQNQKFVMVNIPSEQLTFFDSGVAKFQSRMVVGKTSTPTPTLISEIRNVVYYPYWNIPNSIATREILPMLRRNRYVLDGLRLEVMQNGNVVDGKSINWRRYSARYFPFQLRQVPGCHNALGRLKFDFENPFHVYIHDTNVRLAFLSERRFLSHGCMRIEKPYELAVALGVPPEMVDMSVCEENRLPQVITLPEPVPVFVIYATVDVVDNELHWFEDAYRKFK